MNLQYPLQILNHLA